MARSSARGASSSAEVEVLGLTPHALWILVGDRELMLDYGNFPWFRTATMEQVCDVQLEHGHHLRWPTLDVDLHVDSIENPDHFPLVARERPRRRIRH